MKKAILSLFAFSVIASPLFFSLPLEGYAWFPGQSIVPEKVIECAPNRCQACHLVLLFQNLLSFSIFLASGIAVLLFAYAGFLYVTASASPKNLDTAKKVFTSTLIGFVLILTAWLIVDLVMSTLSKRSLSIWTSWTSGPCEAIDIPERVPVARGISTTTPSSASKCQPMPAGHCSVQKLAETFGDAAERASIVCNAESTGNTSHPDAGSCDRTCGDNNREIKEDGTKGCCKPGSGGKKFSAGLFQINSAVHKILATDKGCGGKEINCPSAYKGKNFNATIRNQDIYDSCIKALEEPECNISVAYRIWYDSGQDFKVDWTQARKCNVN